MARKIALITGAARGIGAAVARRLAAGGIDVVINDVDIADKAAEVRAAIEAEGGRAMVLRADVRSVEAIGEMFGRVEDSWGTVDILVNNAGIQLRQPIRDWSEEQFNAIWETNLQGAFFCAQRAVEPMKTKGWGRVINISSIHQMRPTGFCAPYAISKGGMVMMMREFAREYGPFGITVNNVAPGAIRTDINREVLSDPEFEAKVIDRIPSRFIGTPDDVAPLVAFLVSDEARYINGTTIFVDGGLSV
ncbi:MAG: glucose 1-dehydrogenase [Pirellulaceae bacterium]|nr:glucose 1-dehydrogenase [Pirellulaceae bacterium]